MIWPAPLDEEDPRREDFKRRIQNALNRLRDELDWLAGGDLERVTAVDIHIRFQEENEAEITVERSYI